MERVSCQNKEKFSSNANLLKEEDPSSATKVERGEDDRQLEEELCGIAYE